ncbi:MAG TPA: hypothetical protein VIY48_16250 [Candidatus Paceibacterota bacterium]
MTQKEEYKPVGTLRHIQASELTTGILVDWDCLPERMYRCKVVGVDLHKFMAKVVTLTQKRGKPLYERWVSIADLYEVDLVLPGFEGLLNVSYRDEDEGMRG